MQPRKNTSDFYQMVKPLGAGVAGEVYEAREKSTGRRVAIKRLFPDISQNVPFSAQFYSTLQKLLTAKQIFETTALAPLLDIYQDNEDAHCIVTEFLNGVSLEGHIKKHRVLPEFHALDLALRIGSALYKSYGDLFPFHGLLTPNNIFLTAPTAIDQNYIIKFLDYGMGKAANEYHKVRLSASKRKATVALFSVGDPQYLSPEQCRESNDIDTKADVYAMGLLLFYMLTGKPPFPGNEPIKVMSLQMEADPPSIQDINQNVSQFTQELIRDLLLKDPAKRPTVENFISRIQEQQMTSHVSYNGYKINKFIGAERYLSAFSATHYESQASAVIKLVDPERTIGAYRAVASRFLEALQTRSDGQFGGFVPTIGFGQLAGQQTYAVFEAQRGRLLAETIDGRQSIDSQVWLDRTLLIGKRLAEILSQVHAKKVLYLGLCPQNVQIIEDPRAPDGLVIRLFDTETLRPFHQTEHTLRGSDLPENLSTDRACYLSPEQFFGAADKPADVYALGVILYEMLGGRRPFFADTLEELKALHQQKTALPKLLEVNNAVPTELSEMVHAMLDKVPARRPPLSDVVQKLLLLAESVETQKFSRLALQNLQPFGLHSHASSVPRQGRPPTDEKPSKKEYPPDNGREDASAGSIQALSSELAHQSGPEAEEPKERPRRPPPPRPPVGPKVQPQRFGAYEVLRRIGEGGMGAVYEAVDAQSGQRVAIKVPRPEIMIFPAFAERFHNEVSFAKRINHPGVVQVLQFDRTDDGHPYIVMELINGETLRGRLDKGRLTLSQVIEIAYQTAETLRAAHEAGVVHRDLKPDNIMLVPGSSEVHREVIKILDFGIAKLVAEYQATVLRTAHKTMPGAVLGTPQYMAPEQRQDSSSVTDRADVYSLGVLLYEMLSGRPPLSVEEAVAMLHTSRYIPPPPLQDQANGVPERLVTLVHSMLFEEPGQRPAIGIVCSELRRLARSKEVSTLRENSQQVRRPRRRWPLSLALLSVVGISTFLLAGHWYRRHSIDQRLHSAERAIRESQWNDAATHAQTLLSTEALSAEQQKSARAYLETAMREKQAFEKYEQFVQTSDPELAHRLFQEVPVESIYRTAMTEKHQQAIKRLTQSYLVAAGSAQAAGVCDEWSRQIAQAIALEPNNPVVKAAQREGCLLPPPTPSPTSETTVPVKIQTDVPKTGMVSNSARPADSPLRAAENAYEQGRYREAIRLVQQTVSGLDSSTQVRAWRIMGSAGCQCGDDYSIRDAAELLTSGRAEDDFKRMQTVCARKGYQWDGSHFVRLGRSSGYNRIPGNPVPGRTP